MTAQREKFYEAAARDFDGQALLGRYNATVHLENADDVRFWDSVLQHARPGRYNYVYQSLNYRGDMTSGCEQCLKYRNYLSERFFVCIDSDYRYLRGEDNINPESHILQTYTYSWENHYCQSDVLQNVWTRVCPDEAQIFSFKVFIEDFSRAIYRPLLFLLYNMNNNSPTALTQKCFNKLTALQFQASDHLWNGANIIARLKSNLSDLDALESQTDFDFNAEARRYEAMGVNAGNAYLHFRGHNLYNIVRGIGRQLCSHSAVDFERDVLQQALQLTGYWEIERCVADATK